MTAHVYEKHSECALEERCNICDGGVAHCIICGGAEGSLTTDCSGERMRYEDLERVFLGELDYVNGAWQVIDLCTGSKAPIARGDTFKCHCGLTLKVPYDRHVPDHYPPRKKESKE